MNQALLRSIPKVDVLISFIAGHPSAETAAPGEIRDAVRIVLDDLRNQVLRNEILEIPSREVLAEAVLSQLDSGRQYHLKKVINATGVVLHTNLGRAPLGDAAAAHIAQIVSGYNNLEYDLSTGQRGSRYSHVEDLLCEITGAEAALVVNNNAAAVMLMLNTLAEGKTVAVSRGELVEIGGAFRVPEIMERSGARLLEIGTTNKTHPGDYQRAICEKGAQVLLKVHTSNFHILGFTQSVDVKTLSQIAKPADVLLLEDMGAGFLLPIPMPGLERVPVVSTELKNGVDVVTFSADKLLGSAQAGVILGRKDLIEPMKKNQLTRALRVSKLEIAALEAALRCYRDAQTAVAQIPVLSMLCAAEDALRHKAELLARKVNDLLGEAAPIAAETCQDVCGGGSLPEVTLKGWALYLDTEKPDQAEEALRRRHLPVVARIVKDRLCFSVRTVPEADMDALAQAIAELLK